MTVKVIGSLGILILLLAGCWYFLGPQPRDRYIVKFRVPDGFRGVVTIVHSPDAKPPILEGNVNGKKVFRYEVSREGVVRTSDIGPLDNWHEETAIYSSGQQLPVSGFDTTDKKSIAFRGLTGFGVDNASETLTAFAIVGTYEEAQQFHADRRIWNRIEEQ